MRMIVSNISAFVDFYQWTLVDHVAAGTLWLALH